MWRSYFSHGFGTIRLGPESHRVCILTPGEVKASGYGNKPWVLHSYYKWQAPAENIALPRCPSRPVLQCMWGWVIYVQEPCADCSKAAPLKETPSFWDKCSSLMTMVIAGLQYQYPTVGKLHDSEVSSVSWDLVCFWGVTDFSS